MIQDAVLGLTASLEGLPSSPHVAIDAHEEVVRDTVARTYLDPCDEWTADSRAIASLRLVISAMLAFVTCACGDATDTIVIADQRYSGAEIPLELAGVELIPMGTVVEAANAGRIGLPLFALPGVDPSQVVLARRDGASVELQPFIVYRSLELGDGNLFMLVPELCAYSTSDGACVPAPA